MVQFGVYLESFRNPAWGDAYFSYESLKVLLYQLHKATERNRSAPNPPKKQSDLEEGRAFEEALDENLEKIDTFYNQKIQEFSQTFQDLRGELDADLSRLSQEEKEQLRDKFLNLYVELNLLRDYSNLNYTGFSKLLKKHDKLLTEFKMKRDYFKGKVNKKSVFGILDPIYSLQFQIQNLYSECFEGFNRIDTEISFGEALAKATGDIARYASLEKKKKMMKQGIFTPAYQMPLSGEDLMMPEYMKKKQQKPEVIQSALWLRARLAIMAANTLGTKKDSFARQLIIALLLVMIGGIGQSLSLEYMVRIDPGSGATITFFSFLFIALQGLKDFTYNKPKLGPAGEEIPPVGFFQKLASLRMKPLKIPLLYHAGCVLMSWLSAVLSSMAFRYNISVPFHMVFKSGILLVNMCIGMLVLKKRYTLSQASSVLMVTVGVALCTLASLPKSALETSHDADGINFWNWIFGLSILAVSLVFTGFLGILQDLSYRKFGQHWQEALFYAHFLGLPLFFSLGFEIFEHVSLWITRHPMMWVFLILNIITNFLGVNGVYKVTGLTSSLTGNLTITVRKFISLLISVIHFQNEFTWMHWLGAMGVLVGTMLYTQASQNASKASSSESKKKE